MIDLNKNKIYLILILLFFLIIFIYINTSQSMDLNIVKDAIKMSINGKNIKYNEYLTKESSSTKPVIRFSKNPYKKYTIIMIDPDAPSPSNPINKYHLHWLIINNDQTIMEYSGPSPPLHSGTHRYYTCIFEQEEELYLSNNYPRSKFDLENFVSDNKLNIKGCFKFNVVG